MTTPAEPMTLCRESHLAVASTLQCTVFLTLTPPHQQTSDCLLGMYTTHDGRCCFIESVLLAPRELDHGSLDANQNPSHDNASSLTSPPSYSPVCHHLSFPRRLVCLSILSAPRHSTTIACTSVPLRCGAATSTMPRTFPSDTRLLQHAYASFARIKSRPPAKVPRRAATTVPTSPATVASQLLLQAASLASCTVPAKTLDRTRWCRRISVLR
ncbi:hypothetical protein QBC39DRAFT_63042 [Podospora conica]|nr:hypothetical protein QBC39DRAFT_63042 [Schizothecium conicum]